MIVSTLSESLPNNPDTFKLSTFLCRYHYEPMTLLHALNRMKDSSAYLQLGSGYTRGFGITRFGIALDTKPVSIILLNIVIVFFFLHIDSSNHINIIETKCTCF